MDPPDVDKVQTLTRKLVLDAEKKGTLHTLTPKVLRRQIEKELSLEEGKLDSSEYRNVIKKTIEATMAEVELSKAEQHSEDVVVEPETSKKGASKGKKRTSDIGTEGAPKKKPRVSKKTDDKETKKQGKAKGKNMKKESLPLLDEHLVTRGVDDRKDRRVTKKKSSVKQEEIISTGAEDSEGEESKKTTKFILDAPEAKPPDTDVKMSEPEDAPAKSEEKVREDGEGDYKSESELSVLIDEPPKPKRKRKDKDATNTIKSSSKKSNTKTKKSESLSKDEETIKKLKSLILACGVRKVWSKVFQGLDTPSQQIKKLKEILHELGMTGRMSVEQAKAIKAKREFEQELQDVQEFEKAVLKTKRHGRSDKKAEESESEAGADEEEDEEENPKRRKRKMNAAQSIMAFLGDQSSEEE